MHEKIFSCNSEIIKIIVVLVPGFLLLIWRTKLDSGEGQRAGIREERTGSGSPGGEGGKRGQKLTRRSFVDYYCSSLAKNQYPANNPGNRQFCLWHDVTNVTYNFGLGKWAKIEGNDGKLLCVETSLVNWSVYTWARWVSKAIRQNRMGFSYLLSWSCQLWLLSLSFFRNVSTSSV